MLWLWCGWGLCAKMGAHGTQIESTPGLNHNYTKTLFTCVCGYIHIIRTRFWHKFLYDQGLTRHKEPFHKLVHQGACASLHRA